MSIVSYFVDILCSDTLLYICKPLSARMLLARVISREKKR